MAIYLQAEPAAFFHDMGEILRLFYGLESIEELRYGVHPPDDALCFSQSVQQEGGLWRVTSRASQGGIALGSYTHEAPVRIHTALEHKKYLKRACKISLFRLARTLCADARTPWGSLTGIRPTKMLYDLLDEGMDMAGALDALGSIFDVTPEKAQLLREIVQMQQGVISRAHDKRELDVYIGIPFCTTRCVYCSFASCDIGRDGALMAPYVQALQKEMRAMARRMQDGGWRVRSLYIGGGTPTALPEPLLGQVLEAAQFFLPDTGEFTLEAGRPDTISREKLDLALQAGVKRVSINPQSMQDATLARIGRAHSARDIVTAYDLARTMGFDWINMDLIAGLPGEDATDFADTLARIRALAPENVTVHTLAIKRSSRLHEHLDADALAPPALVEWMVAHAHDALAADGYAPYYLYRQKYMAGNLENVGYARTGRACIYNVDIMEETHANLAMGAGAITKWLFDAEKRIDRFPNVKNVAQYIERVEEMIGRKAGLFD
nr:coproporphyrinogen dehydrogenase HemZ [Maliibacterium massiliense]